MTHEIKTAAAHAIADDDGKDVIWEQIEQDIKATFEAHPHLARDYTRAARFFGNRFEETVGDYIALRSVVDSHWPLSC